MMRIPTENEDTESLMLPTYAIASGSSLILWNAEDSSHLTFSLGGKISDIACHKKLQLLACCYSTEVAVASSSTQRETRKTDKKTFVALIHTPNFELFGTMNEHELQGMSSVSFSKMSNFVCLSRPRSRRRRLGESPKLNFDQGAVLWNIKGNRAVRHFVITDASSPRRQNEEEEDDELVCSQADPTDSYMCILATRRLFIFLNNKHTLLNGEFGLPVVDDEGYEHDDVFSCMEVTSQYVAVGSKKGYVRIFDLSGLGSPGVQTVRDMGHGKIPQSIPILCEWRIPTPPMALTQTKIRPTRRIQQIAFGQGDRQLAILADNHVNVCAWTASEVQQVFQQSLHRSDGGGIASCLSWNGPIMAVGYDDGQVLVFDWMYSVTSTGDGTLSFLTKFQVPSTEPILRIVSLMEDDGLETDSRSHKAQSMTAPLAKMGQPTEKGVPSTSREKPAASMVEQQPTTKQAFEPPHNIDGGRNETVSNGFVTNTERGVPSQTVTSVEPTAPAVSTLKAPTSMQDFVRDEIDVLRQEMQASFRSLHVDILQHFQRQSVECQRTLAWQADTMDRLALENRQLRTEIKQLRDEQRAGDRNHAGDAY